MKTIRILRVDPNRLAIATMTVRAGRDASPRLRQIIRAQDIGARRIGDHKGRSIMVFGGLAVDEKMKGWRLRGGEDTAGVGIVAGQDPVTMLLIDTPVSAAWVGERIQWLDGEDVGDRAARVDELLPMVNQEIRDAVLTAVPLPNGEMWISAANKAAFGEAMRTLGLGTERSGGQCLTSLGEALHDRLIAA